MDIMHITLTAERRGRLPLFANQASYREALHRLGAVCRDRLALFCLIAEHLHLVALVNRRAAGRLAQAAILTLRPLVSTAIAPSYIGEVETRAHMRWLLRYILEQPAEHRMPGHPATWIGSCFPDLVGARLVPGLSLRIAEALPEYRQEMAMRILRLPGEEVAAAGREALRAAGPHRLVSIAEAAFAARPRLAGMGPAERRARRAVIEVSRVASIPRAEVALALRIHRDSATRVVRSWRRADGVDRAALLAIARRLTLEGLIAAALGSVPLPLDREGAAGPQLLSLDARDG